ncbi:hypothetical protein pb186bvf_013793 [Paramecium bursaria]
MTIGRKYYEKTDKQKLLKYPQRIKQEIEKSENFDVTIKLISVLIAMLVIKGDRKLIIDGLNQISLDLDKSQPKVCIDFLQEQLKLYGKSMNNYCSDFICYIYFKKQLRKCKKFNE